MPQEVIVIIRADRLYMCTRFYIEKDTPVLIGFINKAAGSVGKKKGRGKMLRPCAKIERVC